MVKKVKDIFAIIKEIMARKDFWGHITIYFRGSKPVTWEMTETGKIEDSQEGGQ